MSDFTSLLGSGVKSDLGRDGSARIIAEENDTNKIATDVGSIDAAVARSAGLWRRDGQWDSCEMGLTQEEAQSRYNAANTPEERIAVVKDIVERAKQRANLGTAGGIVEAIYAFKPAWHELGKTFDQLLTSSDAQSYFADYVIEKQRGLRNWFNPETSETESKQCHSFDVFRADTGESIGAVGRVHELFQMGEAFELIGDVLGVTTPAIESAAVLGKGEKYFICTRLSEYEVAKDDTIQTYGLFSGAHDGSDVFSVCGVSKRVECENTHNQTRSARNSGLRIKHTKNMRRKVDEARNRLSQAKNDSEQFAELCQQMGTMKFADVKPYFATVVDNGLDVTVADTPLNQETIDSRDVHRAIMSLPVGQDKDAAQKQLERALKRRGTWLDEITERYDSPRNNRKQGIEDTAWSAWNAVTESVDHGDLLRFKGSASDRKENRFASLLHGRGHEIKTMALSTLQESV